MSGIGAHPAPDEMFRMTPRPRATIPGKTIWVIYNGVGVGVCVAYNVLYFTNGIELS